MKPTARRRPLFAALFESLEIRRHFVFHIGSLTDDPDPAYVGQSVTLTANNVGITAGHTFEIDFFRETNGQAGLQFNQDLLVDVDSDPAGGFAVTINTAGLQPGTYTYYAQGQDLGETGGASNVVTTTNTIVRAPPSIASLTDRPDPLILPGNLTLTANGVADLDSPINGVSFYRESNGVAGLQVSDVLLGNDFTGADGYTFTASTTTLGLAPGTYTYYAQALDSTGLLSNVASTTNTISYAPDRYESNDTFETATNFEATDDRLEAGLSLHLPTDVDFYEIYSARATLLDVTIGYTPSAPMTLIMYDAARHELARSAGGTGGYAAVRVDVGNDYGYYFKVLSDSGAANPSYALRIISTPSIASLTVSPSPVLRGDAIKLTANGVIDEGNPIVSYYLESNGFAGLQQNDTLVGEDADGSNGFSFNTAAELSAGTYTYYAVGRDIVGFSGDPVSTTLVVKNHPPAITSISASPYPTSPGAKITLTTNGVSNPDGTSATVTYFRESNGSPGLQPVDGDKVVATADSSTGYTAQISAGNVSFGSNTFYAMIQDPDTGSSPAGPGAPSAVSFHPRPGDANFDGAVNFQDLVVVAQNYNSQGKDVTQGDFDYSGSIGFADLVIIAQQYNTAAAAPIFSAAATPAASLSAPPDVLHRRSSNKSVFRATATRNLLHRKPPNTPATRRAWFA